MSRSARRRALAFVGIGAILVGITQRSACAQDCVVEDDGSGTVTLPPSGCGYVSQDLHQMYEGLPQGTTIEVSAVHEGLVPLTRCPGGALGGEMETFHSTLTFVLSGTGELEGFHDVLEFDAECETHTGPRSPGNPVQSFPTEMVRLAGALGQRRVGEPDFRLFRVFAGSAYGLSSPGYTTLTQLPGGDWSVESYFDITYRIDFAGAAGGPLEGLAGSTTGTIRMAVGESPLGASAPPAASGTRLDAARPNPFRPSTVFPFYLERAGDVELTVFDSTGRLVRRLERGRFDAGRHETSWNGRGENGHLLSSGIYFYELRLDGRVVDRKKTTFM